LGVGILLDDLVHGCAMVVEYLGQLLADDLLACVITSQFHLYLSHFYGVSEVSNNDNEPLLPIHSDFSSPQSNNTLFVLIIILQSFECRFLKFE
jgi:hypothetical protein